MKHNDLDMREDYDFTFGVRGKYTQRFAEGTNLIALSSSSLSSTPKAARSS